MRPVALLLSAALALVLLASPASAEAASATAATSGPCDPDTELGQKAECVIVCLALSIVAELTPLGLPETLVCGSW